VNVNADQCEVMTPKLLELISEVEQELADGLASKGFDNVDDLLADLKKNST
jgi:hypothetical protein